MKRRRRRSWTSNSNSSSEKPKESEKEKPKEKKEGKKRRTVRTGGEEPPNKKQWNSISWADAAKHQICLITSADLGVEVAHDDYTHIQEQLIPKWLEDPAVIQDTQISGQE